MGRHGATAVPPGATLPPHTGPASGASNARRYRRPARLAGRLWVAESGRRRRDISTSQTSAGKGGKKLKKRGKKKRGKKKRGGKGKRMKWKKGGKKKKRKGKKKSRNGNKKKGRKGKKKGRKGKKKGRKGKKKGRKGKKKGRKLRGSYEAQMF